jgi:hypothetical protein
MVNGLAIGKEGHVPADSPVLSSEHAELGGPLARPAYLGWVPTPDAAVSHPMYFD